MSEFFAFRLNQLRIDKNRELFGGAEVKILSLVTRHGVEGDPVSLWLSEFQEAPTILLKGQVLHQATRSILAAKSLFQVDHVKDGAKLVFGDTGYALHVGDQIPESFDWHLLVTESDRDLREVGATIDESSRDPAFGAFTNQFLELVESSASQANLYAALGKYVLGTAGKLLRRNADDQLGVLHQTFFRAQDYPHGIRNAESVPDLSGNMLVDYSIFGTQLPD